MGSSHHDSDAKSSILAKALLQQFKDREDSMVPNLRELATKIGALRDHPEGMYGPEDEGAVRFAVAADSENKKVRVEFGTPVAWMAMDPEQAAHLGKLLLKAAANATGEPVTVEYPY